MERIRIFMAVRQVNVVPPLVVLLALLSLLFGLLAVGSA
jgi:hypothetical protein